MSAPVAELGGFEIDTSHADYALPTLRCTDCRTALCDVENHDTLLALAAIAQRHRDTGCPATPIPYVLTEKEPTRA